MAHTLESVTRAPLKHWAETAVEYDQRQNALSDWLIASYEVKQAEKWLSGASDVSMGMEMWMTYPNWFPRD